MKRFAAGNGKRGGGLESLRPDLGIELALPLGGGGGRGVERRGGAEVAPQAGEALAPRGGGLHLRRRRTNLSLARKWRSGGRTTRI